MVFGNGQNLAKLRVEIEGQKKEIEDSKNQLQTLVNGLTSKNMDLENTVKTMKEQLDNLRGELQKEKTMRENMEEQLNAIKEEILKVFNEAIDEITSRIKNLELKYRTRWRI